MFMPSTKYVLRHPQPLLIPETPPPLFTVASSLQTLSQNWSRRVSSEKPSVIESTLETQTFPAEIMRVRGTDVSFAKASATRTYKARPAVGSANPRISDDPAVGLVKYIAQSLTMVKLSSISDTETDFKTDDLESTSLLRVDVGGRSQELEVWMETRISPKEPWESLEAYSDRSKTANTAK
ncbi:hypothetical protein P7C73_g5474, partial [Tremellales sp. Uapishka_1]